MKSLLIPVSVFLLSSGCAGPANTSNNDSLPLIDTNKGPAKDYVPTEPVKAPNWAYDTTKDEMTSGQTILATTDATNDISFNPPYDGVNGASILVRRRRGSTDVILRIQKGQFMSGVEGENIKVRFDENRYTSYYCLSSNDDDPTVLFIEDAGIFVEHLKKAKKVIIEAAVYDNGDQTFDFSVDGFTWGTSSHKK